MSEGEKRTGAVAFGGNLAVRGRKGEVVIKKW